MSDFAEKYHAAEALARKYRDQPRAGWVKPGSRAKSNQAIMVPRAEVERLAFDLASARYSSYARLYEVMALVDYMHQLADGEPDALECEKCHKSFLAGWMGGKCPYCAAEDAADQMVSEMLGGGADA